MTAGETELPVASLRIERLGSSEYAIHLESSLPGVAPQRIVREGYEELGKTYGTARAALESYTDGGDLVLNPSPQKGAKILGDIRGLGRTLLTALVGERRGQAMKRFHDFFSTVERRTPGGVAPVLTVVSPVDLPFELMPVVGDEHQIVAAAPFGLADQCVSRFLGLRFVLHRFGQSTRPGPTNLALRAGGERDTVVLAPYWNEKVGKVRAELAELAGFGYLAVRDPQPDRGALGQASPQEHIARLLIRDRADREEIVHVAAHCEAPDGDPPVLHTMVFGVKTFPWKYELVRVSGSDLVSAEENVWDENRPGLPDGPLAFLNACRTAGSSFSDYTSIPEMLLNAYYRTVVSPLVTVNSAPAMVLARFFYEALGQRRTVGGALRWARVKLLEEHGNPLGLAYCCHGESRLRVAERAF
ncbi:CHAT domain-containing protein [Amycolatopsis sp. OK19-0408]|uniref:CHAT domain-containing protein n=1 Tax=Amycolatopsis iheyensis TaxID=2945988 RepID=A0A9X2NHJ2_9PSEU|nr:CHAT domain-containing protein [Amycolatopsis iheyensis]MCR6487353.1 CHAT domain-containing protein [Amycolatopsis iheyensis]